jgi:hypothetical protein
LVRFRPAAFSTDASVTMASPMMNAATAFWCGAWCTDCPIGQGSTADVDDDVESWRVGICARRSCS